MTNRFRIAAAPAALILALALAGCAGQPAKDSTMTRPTPAATPLGGAEWKVTAIDGQPVIPGSKVTMQFEDGRVFGAASCNRFMGGYTLGAGLSIQLSQMASTMMACPDELMTQEGRFLKTLGEVTSYSVAGDTATLKTADGRSIVASRP